MPGAVLEVRGLGKSYGSLVAVEEVSFSVANGTCFGLLGPNGAGKTTTISTIAGTIEPDRGEIRMDGAPVGLNHLESKRRIGFVPQDLALYEDLSATDNLRFFGTLYGLHGRDLDGRIERGLTLAGLQDRRKGPVSAFSGGMKRRLNIAAALLHNPDLLILDEPTVGVDPQSRNLIFETLESLISEGKTLLYTTHYMEEAERLCDRVAIMDRGAIIGEGTLAELHQMLPHEPTLVEIEFSRMPASPLDSLPGFAGLTKTTLKLRCDDLANELPQVLEQIKIAGALIERISTQGPTLEEVFLHLTGKSLRD